MAVNGSAEVRQLSPLDLMGHLFRRAGFGATRDELEAALLVAGEDAPGQQALHAVRLDEDEGPFDHCAPVLRGRLRVER